MSKVVKGIKKAFKSVVKVVRKIWKPLVIAAAVYFTAGAALSYFGAAGAAGAATAAGGSMAGAAGGMMGAAGSAAAGAGATAAVGAATSGAFAGVAATATSAVSAGITAAGVFTRTAVQMAAGKPGMQAATNAATAPTAPTTLGGRIGAAVRGMEGYERAMWAQTIISGVSGLMAPKPPTPDEAAQASARFRGSYFGVGEDDQQGFDPVASYNQFWKPREGESYRGGMPDNRDTPAPAPASPAATAAASRPGQNQTLGQPRDTARSTSPPSFLQGDDNADGNAGYYSPTDNYT